VTLGAFKLIAGMEETRDRVRHVRGPSGGNGFLNAQRLRALIRLMRYSGLRISDAVNLSTDRMTDDKLFLYTQKTGTAVNTVLPPLVVKELATTPRVTDKLYFWSGNGELETAVKDWQAKIRTLFDLANVDKGENFMVSHRLRDTFAVECLLAGVPLERVSI
jgi:integrase/recombinase XerD